MSGLSAFNNTALNTGGLFYVTDESVLNVISSKMSNNTSVKSAGCFFI